MSYYMTYVIYVIYNIYVIDGDHKETLPLTVCIEPHNQIKTRCPRTHVIIARAVVMLFVCPLASRGADTRARALRAQRCKNAHGERDPLIRPHASFIDSCASEPETSARGS